MTALTMTPEHAQQIVEGTKTLTNRQQRDGDALREASERWHYPKHVITASLFKKWHVGGIYGIKLSRLAPTCLVDKYGEIVRDLSREHNRVLRVKPDESDTPQILRDELLLADFGYSLLQVRILDIQWADVRDITDSMACAGGFKSAAAYLAWWMEHYDANCAVQAAYLDSTPGGSIVTKKGIVYSRKDYLATLHAKKYTAWQLRFERVI